MTLFIAPVIGQHHSSFQIDVVEDKNDYILVIINNGWFQITGMLLSGTVSNAQPIDDVSGCMEGQVTVVGNGSIRSEFVRMTPGLPCKLASVGSTDVDLSDITITADGFTGVWSTNLLDPISYITMLFATWYGWLIIIFIVANIVFLFGLPTIIDVTFKKYWSRMEAKRSVTRKTKIMISRIEYEYNIRLTSDAGVILLLTVYGKDTIGQLQRHAGMRNIHVRYLVNQLRRMHLLDQERIVPVKSLTKLVINKNI